MRTKRNGIKIILSIGILIMTLIMAACAGLSDWTYDKLPKDYEIWHINTQNIVLVRANSDGTSADNVLEEYVTEFCYNDTYIGIKGLLIDETPTSSRVLVKDMDKSNPSYYLVNAGTDDIMGPYTEEVYEEQVKILEITGLCDWIQTVPAPKGAVF